MSQLTNVLTSIGVAAVTSAVVHMVTYVELQPASPGAQQSGNINVSGNVLAGRVGVGTTPTVGKIQVEDAGSVQGVRSRTGGTAVFGQSTAASGTGYGGYFVSNSSGGRAILGENLATSGGNPRGGLFTVKSSTGIGAYGLNYSTAGGTGLYGESKSLTSGLGVEAKGATGVKATGTNRAVDALCLDQSGTGAAMVGINTFNEFKGTIAGPNGAFAADAGWISKKYDTTYANAVPIAYGTIDPDGNKLSGTSNWTCTYNAGGPRYEITISGESYFYTDYSCLATGVDTTDTFSTSSVGGKLLIKVREAGTLSKSDFGFQFAVFKSNPSTTGPAPRHRYSDDAEWTKMQPVEFQSYLKTLGRANRSARP